ncbi:MAG: DUF2848 domain-containing protein [Rhodobacteraceae bacterium]|nr:DUF2848 domain-containing protein [Paracoccaceae bacterium]
MTAAPMIFTGQTRDGPRRVEVAIDNLVIAGWTGRDPAAVEHHIAELEALGVARPKRTPMFYRVSNHLLTHAPHIQLMGGESSGEAEIVLLDLEDGLWVGVGSDHTDRAAEVHGVTLSKQMCAKPMARDLWPYDEVSPHWDQLVVRSHAWKDGKRRLYQEGRAGELRTPGSLLDALAREGGRRPGTLALFLGTFAAIGGVESADRFDFELEDPVLGRKIAGTSSFEQLAVAG